MVRRLPSSLLMARAPLGNKHAYCTAIGHVAMEWSSLENSIHRLLWRLVGLDSKLGRCVTQHIAFGTLWDAILALAEELPLPKGRRDHLRNLQGQCEPLRLRRNEVVHALWASTPTTELGKLTAVVVKARRRLKVEFNHHTVEYMHDLAEQISALSLAIANEAVRPLDVAA
jgi:hypothetical protein